MSDATGIPREAGPAGRETAQAIDAGLSALSEAVVAEQYVRSPELARRWGPEGRTRCREDATYHLCYLSQSLRLASPSLFTDYVAWAKIVLQSRGIPPHDLAENLSILRDVLAQALPADAAALATDAIEAARSALPELPNDLPGFLDPKEPLADLANTYLAALLRGDRRFAARLIEDAVEAGVGISDLYLRVFQPCQREVGRLWQTNQVGVAQEHYCSAATQLIMAQLYPRVLSAGDKTRTVVATCVGGDLHEIGLRMVSDFLEMAGWDTYYLGANTPTPSLLQTLAERRTDLLLVSVTILGHLHTLTELIAAVRASEALRNVKILVGGYPFNIEADLWRKVGADACAPDAQEAVIVAGRLVPP